MEKVPDRLGRDLRYSVDISQDRARAGYRPLVPFDQGLAETVKWFIDNQLVGAIKGSGSAGVTLVSGPTSTAGTRPTW